MLRSFSIGKCGRLIRRPACDGEIERSAQRREFAIDLGGLRPGVLPIRDEAPDLWRANGYHPAALAKERQQVRRDFAPHVTERLACIRLVVRNQMPVGLLNV